MRFSVNFVLLVMYSIFLVSCIGNELRYVEMGSKMAVTVAGFEDIPEFTNQKDIELKFTYPAGRKVECVFDQVIVSNCVSPIKLSNLSDGPHEFIVRFLDLRPNEIENQNILLFTVDTTAPQFIDRWAGSQLVSYIQNPQIQPVSNETISIHSAKLNGVSQVINGELIMIEFPANTATNTLEIEVKDLAGNMSSKSYSMVRVNSDFQISWDANATTRFLTDQVNLPITSTRELQDFECRLNGELLEPCLLKKVMTVEPGVYELELSKIRDVDNTAFPTNLKFPIQVFASGVPTVSINRISVTDSVLGTVSQLATVPKDVIVLGSSVRNNFEIKSVSPTGAYLKHHSFRVVDQSNVTLINILNQAFPASKTESSPLVPANLTGTRTSLTVTVTVTNEFNQVSEPAVLTFNKFDIPQTFGLLSGSYSERKITPNGNTTLLQTFKVDSAGSREFSEKISVALETLTNAIFSGDFTGAPLGLSGFLNNRINFMTSKIRAIHYGLNEPDCVGNGGYAYYSGSLENQMWICDGAGWKNSSEYLTTTVLHEARHMYDIGHTRCTNYGSNSGQDGRCEATYFGDASRSYGAYEADVYWSWGIAKNGSNFTGYYRSYSRSLANDRLQNHFNNLLNMRRNGQTIPQVPQ